MEVLKTSEGWPLTLQVTMDQDEAKLMWLRLNGNDPSNFKGTPPGGKPNPMHTLASMPLFDAIHKELRAGVAQPTAPAFDLQKALAEGAQTKDGRAVGQLTHFPAAARIAGVVDGCIEDWDEGGFYEEESRWNLVNLPPKPLEDGSR